MSRSARVLVAACGPVVPVSSSGSGVGARLGVQRRCYEAYRSVPEIRALVAHEAQVASKARVVVEERRGADWVEVEAGPAFDLWRALLAVAEVDVPELIARSVTCLRVAGEGLWRVETDPSGRPLSVAVRSVVEFSKVDRKREGDRVMWSRMWRPSAEDHAVAESSLMSLLDVVDELRQLRGLQAALASSRLVQSGLALVNDEVSFGSPDGRDDGGEQAEELEDPFLTELDAAFGAKMRDLSPAPILLRVPGELFDRAIRFVSADRPADDDLRLQRLDCIVRIARGLEYQPEMLTGLGEANTWTAAQIQAEFADLYVPEVLRIMTSSLTRELLWPLLPDAERGRWRLGFDVAPCKPRPADLSEALQLHAAGALSTEALLRTGGRALSDRASVDELVGRLVLQRASFTPDQVAVLFRSVAGVELPSSGSVGSMPVAPQPLGAALRDVRDRLPSAGAPPAPGSVVDRDQSGLQVWSASTAAAVTLGEMTGYARNAVQARVQRVGKRVLACLTAVDTASVPTPRPLHVCRELGRERVDVLLASTSARSFGEFVGDGEMVPVSCAAPWAEALGVDVVLLAAAMNRLCVAGAAEAAWSGDVAAAVTHEQVCAVVAEVLAESV